MTEQISHSVSQVATLDSVDVGYRQECSYLLLCPRGKTDHLILSVVSILQHVGPNASLAIFFSFSALVQRHWCGFHKF